MNILHTTPLRLARLTMALTLVLGLLLGFVPTARAASLTVTNTNNSGAGSLRQTIADAASGDTITFNLSGCPCTITLSGELVIGKNLTIAGPGAKVLTVSGNNAVRVIQVNGGVSLNLSGLTLADGMTNSSGGYGAAIYNNGGSVTVSSSTFSGNSAGCGPSCGTYGGAIANLSGVLNVTNSTFSGNSASGDGGGIAANYGNTTVTNSTFSGNNAPNGGGISNYRGNLTVTNSTFSGNSALYGGGISTFDGDTTVTNSTFSGNSAPNSGGGIANSSSSFDGSLTVTNSTFSGNSARNGASIYNINPFVDTTLKNTVIATSTGNTNCYGAMSADSHTLASDGSCGAATLKSLAELKLGSLANNGGPTQTIALPLGSAAINAGDDTICAAASVNNLDQRGVARPQGAACDSGAFELEVTNQPPTSITLDESSVAENQPAGTTVGTFSTTDPDAGDTFTYALVSGDGDADNGSFTIEGNTLKTAASFDYESKNSYSIRVRSTDAGGLFFEQVFSISVSNVNENVAPVANNDDVSTNEDTALTGNVLSNDSDTNGDTLTARKISDPQHGTLTLNSDGSFTYTPDANYNGPDSFRYKANDGTADSNVATVNITVNAVNDPPVASGQSISTAEDTAKNITLAANDVESTSLTYTVVSAPAHGTLSGTAPNLTYTPAADYNGSDSFSFKANDGTVDSNVATISITVNAVNDAPTIAIAAGGACLADFKGQANLTLGDVETAAGSLTLSASSSNTTLVPNGTITFGGSGANRTVTIATASGKSGSATVTITVRDSTTTTSTTIKVVAGTSNNDSLTGSTGADMLFGGNGQDTLQGGGGNDLVCGGSGDDKLYGSNGDDTLDAGSGQDRLYGEDGNDILLGGSGDDQLLGGSGDDTLRAGDGNDKLDGGANNDQLYGEGGDDTLTGGSGADSFDGGPNNDTTTDYNAGQGDTRVNIP